ncbi:MAG: alpha-hydroxy acid oxidase [Gammaproteobacteria bacterium]|nr:alpha-hydroxy acid oxidase [Gammaproteobacteria bacterium]
MTVLASRRAFLGYLAASPVFTPMSRAYAQLAGIGEDRVIDNAADAINVFDFEPVARRNLTSAHYTYMAMGVDDGATLLANRQGFEHLQIRPRRLVDVRNIDTRIELFGISHASPVIIAPCGTHKMYHPDGELAVARASATRDCLQILSTVTTTSVEDVNRARGAPVWYQLYPTEDWRITEALVKRAEDAGCPAVAVTVDLPNSNREAIDRFRRAINPECLACHEPGLEGSVRRKPMFDGLDLSAISNTRAPQMDWDFVERLKNLTSMKVLLKGIVTHEDASLALQHGVDGLIVSNHGGRAIDSRRATIESLPEVVDAIGGRIPVLVDGGFRRGTDIFKALAIGADAICIGRPYLWGLSAFGQDGVESVLDLLNRELEIMMQQAGTPNLGAISRNFLVG